MIVVVVLALAGLYVSTSLRLGRTYTVQPAAVAVPSGAAAIERGRHLASSRGCTGWHGDDLAGTPFFDDPALGRIPSSNLTHGRGGVGGAYGDVDWVRAIRHGVNRQGRGLLIMPAEAYYWFGDDDLGAIIAYVKSVPPVDRQLGSYAVTPLAHLLAGAGALGNFIAAETIDHSAARVSAPAPGVTKEYGEYLMKTEGCRGCHGPALSGAQPSEPGAPLAPNLTPGGSLRTWSETSFIQAMRTRESPFMPFKSIGLMTDDELKALWLYL